MPTERVGAEPVTGACDDSLPAYLAWASTRSWVSRRFSSSSRCRILAPTVCCAASASCCVEKGNGSLFKYVCSYKSNRVSICRRVAFKPVMIDIDLVLELQGFPLRCQLRCALFQMRGSLTLTAKN